MARGDGRGARKLTGRSVAGRARAAVCNSTVIYR